MKHIIWLRWENSILWKSWWRRNEHFEGRNDWEEQSDDVKQLLSNDDETHVIPAELTNHSGEDVKKN